MSQVASARSVADAEPLLVFIHIPKTAGTTVRYLVRTNAPGSHRKPGSNVFHGGGGASGKMIDKLRDDAKSLPLDGVKVLHGHHPLGISNFLEPAFPDRDFRYITFLRDPVDRMLSHYYNVRNRGILGAELEPEEKDVVIPDNISSLDEAIAAGVLHDNLHTRMLSGQPRPFGEVTDRMLNRAKRNIGRTLSLVGISERMDESLVLAKQRLGFFFYDILPNASHRVNAQRPRGEAVPEELRAAAERANQHDIELYRFALALFEEAVERESLEFHLELAALQTARVHDGPRPQTPAPEMFPGTQEEWELVVAAQAELLQLRSEASREVVRTMRLDMKAATVDEPDAADADGSPRPKKVRRRRKRSYIAAS